MTADIVPYVPLIAPWTQVLAFASANGPGAIVAANVVGEGAATASIDGATVTALGAGARVVAIGDNATARAVPVSRPPSVIINAGTLSPPNILILSLIFD